MFCDGTLTVDGQSFTVPGRATAVIGPFDSRLAHITLDLTVQGRKENRFVMLRTDILDSDRARDVPLAPATPPDAVMQQRGTSRD